MTHPADRVRDHLSQLFNELLEHDGYGDLSVEIRILKRGQKEVLIRCGKQYRYVVDFEPSLAHEADLTEVPAKSGA